MRNFRAEYFGSSFGGKAIAAVNFIARPYVGLEFRQNVDKF
ncbi:hypothetical protein [uncultured Campylobacter sp.]|nr:hypothetical protein [uncultured Campylobacter sp.]